MRSGTLASLISAVLLAGCGGGSETATTQPGPSNTTEGGTAPAAPPSGPAERVPPGPDRTLLRDAGPDGKVHLTFGISGSRLVPKKVAFPAGRPLSVSLVSLDRRKHVLGLARRPIIEVFGNIPHSVRQAALAPGRYRVVLDGNRSSGEVQALTASQMRRARLRESRLGPPKQPASGTG